MMLDIHMYSVPCSCFVENKPLVFRLYLSDIARKNNDSFFGQSFL